MNSRPKSDRTNKHYYISAKEGIWRQRLACELWKKIKVWAKTIGWGTLTSKAEKWRTLRKVFVLQWTSTGWRWIWLGPDTDHSTLARHPWPSFLLSRILCHSRTIWHRVSELHHRRQLHLCLAGTWARSGVRIWHPFQPLLRRWVQIGVN